MATDEKKQLALHNFLHCNAIAVITLNFESAGKACCVYVCMYTGLIITITISSNVIGT